MATHYRVPTFRYEALETTEQAPASTEAAWAATSLTEADQAAASAIEADHAAASALARPAVSKATGLVTRLVAAAGQ